MKREPILQKLSVLEVYRPKDKDEASAFNKLIFKLGGELATMANEDAKSKRGGGTKEDLQEFLKNPMTDDCRNRHIRAAIDVELASGASIKDIAEIAKTFGLGQGEDAEILVCDFTTAVEYWDSIR